MKLPGDGHSHFQGLISARLDGLLLGAEERELSEHLAECPTCRAVSRDYRSQRGLMASLNVPPAPRDLWARTSAALDREMARTPRASGRAGSRHSGPVASRPAPGSRWLGLTAATSVLLAGAVVATQIQSNVVPTTGQHTQAARATPFDVAPQDMSVFDFTGHGVSVYQTRVTEVCPPPQIDCLPFNLPTSPVMHIAGNSASNGGLAVNSRTGRLAIVTTGAEGADTVSVVDLPPYRNVDATSAPATPRSTPVGSGLGSSGGSTPSPVPQVTDSPTPTATPAPTVTPKPTRDASATPPPMHTGPDTSPTSLPASPTPKPDKSPKPTPLPSEPAASNAPEASDGPGSSVDATPSPSDAVTTPGSTGADPSTQPDEAALAIAEGVRLIGAAPAWSVEGDMFAFSATPADLSTGPDVYLWRVGEKKAVRLTQDHRSYFASWAEERIVISRIPTAAAGGTAAGPVDARTIVMDLATGEERAATGPSMWLPTVDPLGRYAVAWVGRLRSDGHQVTPRVGGLYLVDWTQIDPFAPNGGTSGTPAVATTPDAGATQPDSATTPDGATTPAPTKAPRHLRPSPSASVEPTTAPVATDTTVPATSAPTDPARAPVVQAVDPQRNEAADPVLDWVVRWSADGATVGIWVADSLGANWGRLAVARLALQDGQFSRDSVLGPNLARRAFSMGADRVAWVAPSDDSADGDLRIRTWGAKGYGDLRIHSVDAGDGVPSF